MKFNKVLSNQIRILSAHSDLNISFKGISTKPNDAPDMFSHFSSLKDVRKTQSIQECKTKPNQLNT